MLSIVAPVFNEEQHIAEFIDRCLSAAQACPVSSFELILVDDGSRDHSREIIIGKIRENPGLVKLIELSRNFGQQPAFHAGLSFACGDMVVTVDSDLQDPPELIPKLIEKMREGFDLVYAKRVNHRGGTWGASGHAGLKSVGAYCFHRLVSRIKNTSIPSDVGEYRAMSRKVVDHLLEFCEYMIFMPGLIAHISCNAGFVEYVRNRRGDRTRTTMRHLVVRALDGLTTFSVIPIHLVLVIGFTAWLLPAVALGWMVFDLISGRTPALTSVVLFAALIAWCLTLSMLAVVAHYVGRIFLEVKRRPKYFVKRVIEKPDGE